MSLFVLFDLVPRENSGNVQLLCVFSRAIREKIGLGRTHLMGKRLVCVEARAIGVLQNFTEVTIRT